MHAWVRTGPREYGQELGQPALTVDVLPIADVLQVAARVLAAQVRVGPVGLQPGVSIPPQLRAGRHAARGSVPHLRGPPGSCCARLAASPRARGAGGGGVEGRPARRPPRKGAEAAADPGSAAAAAARPRHGRRRPRLPLGLPARPPRSRRVRPRRRSARVRATEPPSLAHPAAAMASSAALPGRRPSPRRQRQPRQEVPVQAEGRESARRSGRRGPGVARCGEDRREEARPRGGSAAPPICPGSRCTAGGGGRAGRGRRLWGFGASAAGL